MDHQKWLDRFNAMIVPESPFIAEDPIPEIDSHLLSFHPLTSDSVNILNLAASCLDSTELYCEITNYPNFALASIMSNQPDVMAYSVIDSRDQENLLPLDEFVDYLLSTDLSQRVMLCQQSLDNFFQDLNDIETEDKIGLLFYDAAHDYQTQFSTLLQVRPFLADKALIIINQNHWQSAQKASLDFAQIHPEFQLCFDGTSESELLKWNGLQIFEWHQNDNVMDCTISRIPESIIQGFTLLDLQQEQQRASQIWFQKVETCIESKDLQTALQICQMLIRWQPVNAGLWLQQSWIYFKLDKIESALKSSIQARKFALDQQASVILKELAILLRDNQYISEAERTLIAMIDLDKTNYEPYNELAFLHIQIHDYDKAAEFYQQCLELNPTSEEAYCRYIGCLLESSQLDKALILAEKAIQEFSNSVRVKSRVYLLLPVLYEYSDDISQYRQRFTDGLDRLVEEIKYETEEQRDQAFVGLGFATNFYLGYQNNNDLDLQIKYGQLISQVMSLRFPQFQEFKPMSALVKNEKIRVGYVSCYLHYHTISKLFGNWMLGLDKQKIEVFVYYLGSKNDGMIERFKKECHDFKILTTVIDLSAQQIIDDHLDVLVYLDIGMDPKTSMLAALRLAPIQCMAWGHPITSGFPTIDYFLSSELMEPISAEEHYSEKLVRLPNLSVAYSQPQLSPVKHRPRSEVLSVATDDDILYLSCQSLFKYLPQYDFIYPAIAEQVPQAKFIFLSHFSRKTNELFLKRLKSAFELVDLNSDDYCFVLPRQEKEGYFALNQVSDIYLDTFAWSGGNTTFEAVACGLPIVTCPGEFMRGRHSYAILKMLEVTETIAENEQDYIDIAIKLGLDPVWRQEIVASMRKNQSKLYDDPVCLQALQAFYQQVVGR